jgi:predicted acyltransferase
VNTNTSYAIYGRIYLLGLLCAIPVVIMVLFGYLAYRNIRLTRVLAQQQADRQLTRMILIQVLLVVIFIVPYGINGVYDLITSGVSKDTNRIIAEGFASTILSVVSYFYFAVCLFIFVR